MGHYLDELVAQLRRTDQEEARTRLIQRLMYTSDRRAARHRLLEVTNQDNNAAFWIGEAFSYYFSKDRGLWTMPWPPFEVRA